MYCYRDLEAAQHVMRVASGLDSQVLGEPQIMGQLKSAYDAAKDIGTMGPELRLLERASLNIAKRSAPIPISARIRSPSRMPPRR